jgi:O-antigen ligase
MQWRRAGSRELLIPAAFIAIIGSRPVSSWLGSGGASSSTEGDPINTFTFAFLLISSLFILNRQHFRWGEFFRENGALLLIYGFFVCSSVWSELPLVSLKRLVKDFTCVPLALLILRQPNVFSAMRAIYVRVSYLLFPLSIIFIKYFPEIGRSPAHNGENTYTGVTTQKNSLGELVFVLSVFIVWDAIEIYQGGKRRGKKMQLAIRGLMILMGQWLLVTCDSQTSLICLVLAVVVLMGSKRLVRTDNGKKILVAGLATALTLMLLDKTLNLSDPIIRALGRNPTLTGRTEIWRIVKEQNTGPLLGEGFYTFWDTEKGGAVVDALTRINSAHNGYLETYVDGGIVGVCLLILFLIVATKRVIRRAFTGNVFGCLGLAFCFTAIIYNMSESSFFRLDLLWFTLLLVTVECAPRFVKKVVRPTPPAGKRQPAVAGSRTSPEYSYS